MIMYAVSSLIIAVICVGALDESYTDKQINDMVPTINWSYELTNSTGDIEVELPTGVNIQITDEIKEPGSYNLYCYNSADNKWYVYGYSHVELSWPAAEDILFGGYYFQMFASGNDARNRYVVIGEPTDGGALKRSHFMDATLVTRNSIKQRLIYGGIALAVVIVIGAAVVYFIYHKKNANVICVENQTNVV
eukprot:58271_1